MVMDCSFSDVKQRWWIEGVWCNHQNQRICDYSRPVEFGAMANGFLQNSSFSNTEILEYQQRFVQIWFEKERLSSAEAEKKICNLIVKMIVKNGRV